MFHIVLFQPEIAPNTGNIIRLCANTGTALHLIHPLGFDLDDRKLRRAGLDYDEYTSLKEYQSMEDFLGRMQPARLFAVSTRGQRHYSNMRYRANDAFLFGPETRGLPQEVLDELGGRQVLRIPMKEPSRSLNLANAAAVILYEAWRQLDFRNG